MADPNSKVLSFLDYYHQLQRSPKYAVLLYGPWGAGKTHLVKGFVQSRAVESVFYVSLFGVGSKEEFDQAVFSAVYPALTGKGAKFAGAAFKAALKFANVEFDLKANDVLDSTKSGLFIFDDLERAATEKATVLGYINEFVEHDGVKTIILANVDAIDETAFEEKKEKVIGRSLLVRADFAAAAPTFLSEIENKKIRDEITKHLPNIKSIFIQSESENLRVLQQTLWDLERLLSIIDEKWWAFENGMADLIRVFVALSIEVKTGRLSHEIVRDLMRQWTQSFIRKSVDEKIEKNPCDIAYERYSGVALHDPIFSSSFLSKALFEGTFDAQELSITLGADSRFIDAADEPAWQILWYGAFHPTDIAEKAVADMEAVYTGRLYTKIGEILHLFSLRLELSKWGIIDASWSDIVAQAKQYIDDLYASKKLPSLSSFRADDFHGSGALGFGFGHSDTSEFREISEYLFKKCDTAFIDDYKAKAPELLKELTANPESFKKKLYSRDDRQAEFERVPILAEIPASNFVESLLKLAPIDQRKTAEILTDRYRDGGLSSSLAPEAAWRQEVKTKLIEAYERAQGFEKARLERFLRWHFDHSVDAPVDSPTQGGG